MTLPTPNAFIFDWDNTLVNTWPVIHAALVHTFEQFGHEPWTFDETTRRVKKSMRDSFPELFGDEWQRAGDIYLGHYRAHHLEHLQPLAGTVAMLQHVRNTGAFVAVVSNKKGESLRMEVEHLGFAPYFDAVVGSGDAAHDKPHGAPVSLAFAQSPVSVSRATWFVGDSDVDLLCAGAVGASAVLYAERAATHEGFTSRDYFGAAYDALVMNHEELVALVDKSASR